MAYETGSLAESLYALGVFELFHSVHSKPPFPSHSQSVSFHYQLKENRIVITVGALGLKSDPF